MKTVYVYILDTLADWELGHVLAELNSRRFFKAGAPEVKLVHVGASLEPVVSMGGISMAPDAVVDEIAVQPLIYLSKQLLTTTQAKIIAEGYLDLKAGLFSDTPSLISIPLLSCRKIALNGKQILKENAPDGSVELSAVAI